mmetsp:Transcript_7882/g.13174  ORF Transcript_7882/g.13174 Transcript_7882/m.13174 type:complete len:237 (+) Transcript_7882:534-1244(+)
MVEGVEHFSHAHQNLHEVFNGQVLVCVQAGWGHERGLRLDHCVLGEIEEVGDAVVVEVFHHHIVPRPKRHLVRRLPHLGDSAQLWVPHEERHASVRGPAQRAQHHEVGLQVQSVKFVRSLVGLPQPNLVQRVVRLVHVALVHPRLRVASSLAMPHVQKVEAQAWVWKTRGSPFPSLGIRNLPPNQVQLQAQGRSCLYQGAAVDAFLHPGLVLRLLGGLRGRNGGVALVERRSRRSG